MGKEIAQYHYGTFNDFKGEERHFCVALVSKPMEASADWREVSVGFAICHEHDVFSPEVGQKIAYSKATNGGSELSMVCHGSMMTYEIGELIMKTLAKYFVSNPEFQIPGYLDMKAEFEESQKLEEQKKGLSVVELDTVNYLKSLDKEKLSLMIKLAHEN